MLDDYTKAEFPLDLKLEGSRHARIYATDGKLVVGVTWYGDEFHLENHCATTWRGDGKWAADPAAGSIMHLPLPPGLVDARKIELLSAIDQFEKRLADNPDAPEEWRSIDQRKLDAARAELLLLAGDDQ